MKIINMKQFIFYLLHDVRLDIFSHRQILGDQLLVSAVVVMGSVVGVNIVV